MVGRVRGPRWSSGRLLTAVLLVHLCAAHAGAQRLPITPYTTREGLPHYVVNRIVGDSRGFLWFCTREGLARFDGREFVRFGTEHGLPSATVNDLVEARDGTYWLATNGGLVHFDPRRAPRFTTFHLGPRGQASNVAAIALDSSGDVWAGTASGLFRARATPSAGIELTRVGLDVPDRPGADAIGSLLVDHTGALWIATLGRLHRRAGEAPIETINESDGIPWATIRDMLEDRSGRIWLATSAGLFVVGPADSRGTRRVTPPPSQTDGLPGGLVSSLLQDSRGTLWAGTSSGLVRMALDSGSIVDVRVITEVEGLPGREIDGLAEDTHGNVWFGVVPFGAVKLSWNGFTSFSLPAPQTFPSTLLETTNGDLVVWGASAGGWAGSRFNGQRFTPVPGARPEGTPSWGWNQMVLQDRAGSWWFGSNEGLVRYPPGLDIDDLSRARPIARYTRAHGLAADVVLRLYEDPRGDVWVSTVGHGERPNGLSVWRRGLQAVVRFAEDDGLPALDRFYVSSFAADRGGNLWVGFSGDAGLARHDGQRFERFAASHGVPPGQVRNFLLDSRGRLWAALYRSGLLRIERPESPRPAFRVYTTADGLSSNETHALVEAPNGDLFVGTARGIDRLSAAEGRWSHFTQQDGLPPGEMQGAIRDRQGALWFSYNTAVLRLVPVQDRPVVPSPIFITAINTDGRDHPVSAVGERHVGPLTLPSGGTARIEFVAPWFGAPSNVAYQYRLEGAKREWTEPTDLRSVTYANMAPGKYTFTVRSHADGVAGQSPATVSLTVVPPFWRWPPFVVALACATALLAYGAYRFRMRRVLELANLRTRIATDLHDDIGANLTRIGILSEVVRHQGAGGASTGESRLESIARLARESVEAMSHIVWAINPERDTLVDLGRKLREVAEDVAAASGAELEVSVPDASSRLRLDMDVRRDLFLIGKEALNNAARHARCRNLRLSLGCSGDRLALEVVDDGRGFDAERDYEGNGLASMQRRAARLGAQLSLRSAPGRGTTVRVVLPLGHRGRTAVPPTRTGR